MSLFFLSHVLYSIFIDWFVWISHSTLRNTLTVCADQLLYNSSLIKLCLAYVKESIEKTGKNCKNCKRCLLIVSIIDITWSSRTTPEFINYQLWTSYKALVWNIYFTFSLPVVDYTFYKSSIKSNCMLLSCHVRFSE